MAPEKKKPTAAPKKSLKPASSMAAPSAKSGKSKKSLDAVKALLKNKKHQKYQKPKPKSKPRAEEVPVEEAKLVKRKLADMDEMAWKEVDVTDSRMGDFEGFFGLEELDGVTINKTEDGKLEFLQKEKNIVKKLNTLDSEDLTGEAGVIKKKAPAPVEGTDAKSDSTTTKKDGKKKKKAKTTKEAAKPIDEAQPDEKDDLAFNPFEALEKLPEVDTSSLEWDLGPETVLSQPIQQSLAALKYWTPTEIQKQAIPEVVAEHDIIGKAATGSGKTLAYGIPILERHLRLASELATQSAEKGESGAKEWPTGLIFAPTRELAHQIVKHITDVAKYCPITGSGIIPLTGGLSIQKQMRLIALKPAVVVATPGRFLEILENNKNILESFKKSEILVLDEADRMLQEGHFKEMGEILDLLGRGKTSQRQTLVFSATFQKEFMNKLANKKGRKEQFDSGAGRLSSNDEALVTLQKKLQFKEKPIFVDANPAEAVASKVHECLIECGNMEKDLYLYYFTLMYPGRTIVFVNSIDAVKRLAPLLNELQIPAFAIHSNMVQKQRLRSLERFRAAEHGVLIATDVAARGLDIPLIQHVVHYHLPRTADMYVHRSGRTARAGTEGVSVLLCAANEASGPLVKLKKVLYKDQVEHNPLQPFEVDYDVVGRIRDRVTIAKKIVDSNKESTYKGKDNSWMSEAASDLGIDLDSDFDMSDDDNRPRPKGWQSMKPKKKDAEKILSKDELKHLREQLVDMLKRPINSRSSKYLTSGRINLAQMVLSGNSHEAVLGHSKNSALEDVGRKSKKQKSS